MAKQLPTSKTRRGGTNTKTKEVGRFLPVNSHTYRHTASFGRRHEYIAAAELLKRGFDVYMTLVDDQGIDCVIRIDERNYLDIQIKARSRTAKQPNLFAGMKFVPRPNLWFVFFTEMTGHYWVIPSTDVARFGYRNKSGKNKGKISLSLPHREIGVRAARFQQYRDDIGFDLMRANVPA